MSNVQFGNMSCLSRKFIGKIQTAESVRISVKTDIREVLSVGVDSAVNSYESSQGEVSFYGKTNIKFLYSDGTTVLSSGYSADFTASMTSELLDTDSKLTFDVVTVDSKVDINANTAMLTILLEVTAYAYVSDSVPYMLGSDEVFCKTDGVEILQSCNIVNLPIVIDEELNATRNITTVLVAESNLCATDYTVMSGVLRIAGDASVRLTYVSEGKIVTDTLPFSFERELDATGIDADSQLRLSLTVKNTKVRLDISENEVNTAFTVEITANARIEATKIGVIDVVNDAYGSNCDFLLERRSLTTTLPCGSTTERKRISASLPLDTDKTVLTAVNVGAVVTNCQSMEQRALIEGVVYATLLYATDVGTESEQLELPFSETVEVDYLMPQCQSFADVAVMDFAVKDNGGLQAEMELCIDIVSERNVTFSVVVSAEEQPFDKSQLPAIEVCLAHKGETLWQLAKGLHMSEEDLLATNPEITNPLEQDARIVIFNKI
ncbi:MAG: DUF3794 domain-containing protein [Clostridiales bacterium]|nr:DUF3794 domain-containing protein [Clostridiales bacterium]